MSGAAAFQRPGDWISLWWMELSVMLPGTLLHKQDSGTQIQMLIMLESLPAHSKGSHTPPLQGLLSNTEGLDFLLIQSTNREEHITKTRFTWVTGTERTVRLHFISPIYFYPLASNPHKASKEISRGIFFSSIPTSHNPIFLLAGTA